jgi:hypothetical protein
MATLKKIESLGQEMNWMLRVGGGFIVFGLVLMGYGFWKWRAIQLKQDRVLEMELKKYGVPKRDSA